MDDPLDAVFAEPEKLEGENRAKLAKLIVRFVAIEPESGEISYKPDTDKLTAKQLVLVFLLSRLALSTRNPAFPAALAPKEIELKTGLPGGTLRPKLTELTKERCVYYDTDGKYSVRVVDLGRARLVLSDALLENEKPRVQSSSDAIYPQSRIKALAEIFELIKEPSWRPDRVDTALLKRLRIGSNYESKAIQTLRFLGLIDNDGTPLPEFDELKRNFQPMLARLVGEKYSALFKILPTQHMNQNRLVSFFGEPTESAEYKAVLFAWLCAQASVELPNVGTRFHRARFQKKEDKNNEQ